MKLHVLSDLHLSVQGMEHPHTDADVVILAGDIARPAQAIEWACGFGKPVLYVPGNHEFYGSSLAETVRGMQRQCAGTPVQVLSNQAVTLQGVRFVCSTLWSDFRIAGDDAARQHAMAEAQTFVRDFSRIRTDADPDSALFTPQDAAQQYDANVLWLQEQIGTPFDGPTVVITHHAPSPRSIHPRFEGSVFNAVFVSNAEHLLDGQRVPLWIHGHTHDSFDYTVNGTRVLCNPRGYGKEGKVENSAFDPVLVVEINRCQPRAW